MNWPSFSHLSNLDLSAFKCAYHKYVFVLIIYFNGNYFRFEYIMFKDGKDCAIANILLEETCGDILFLKLRVAPKFTFLENNEF